MWVRSLGGEDSLEEGMATHSSFLAWRISWTEEPAGPQSMGSQSQIRWSDLAGTHTGEKLTGRAGGNVMWQIHQTDRWLVYMWNGANHTCGNYFSLVSKPTKTDLSRYP